MAIHVLSENETAGVTRYILRQETDILSQKVITATYYKQTGTIIINNGKHDIKTKANNNPIRAIENALQ